MKNPKREQQIREKVRKRDSYRCYFCERDIRKSPIKSLESSCHHVIPKMFGGKFEKENLITICKSCHKKYEDLFKIALDAMPFGWKGIIK